MSIRPSTSSDDAPLLERIEKLERKLRATRFWQPWVIITFVVVLTAPLWLERWVIAPGELSGHSLNLIPPGEEGGAALLLAELSGSPGLFLSKGADAPSLLLAPQPEGGILHLDQGGEPGQTRAALAWQGARSFLNLSNRQGRIVAELSVTEDGAGTLVLRDAGGQILFQAP